MGNKSENKKTTKSETQQKVEKNTSKKEKKEVKEEVKEEVKPEQEAKPEQPCDKFDEQLSSTQEECGKLKELLKSIGDRLKKLQATHKSEVKKMKSRKNKRSENHKPTGFARLRPVTGKLAHFIGVESGTELSGPEVTKKVWAVLKSRNLTYQGDEKKGVKGDQRVLRVDEEVSKLFNVPMSVNKSVDHKDAEGFNFGNLQKYIKNAMTDSSTPAHESNHDSTHESKKKEKPLSK
jgi:hypothetical protein